MSTDNPIVTKFSLLPKPKARTKTRNKRKTLTRSHFPKKLKRKTCQASFFGRGGIQFPMWISSIHFFFCPNILVQTGKGIRGKNALIYTVNHYHFLQQMIFSLYKQKERRNNLLYLNIAIIVK